MALSVDPSTYIIYVPKSDLTLVQSTPTEIRELNLNEFRLDLKDWEDSPEGIIHPKTNDHNTEVTLGGLTYARVIEILDPYSVTFEDGQYAVNLVGANSNVGDKVNVNQVSVRSANSAGLISSPAIEFNSFNNRVAVDLNSSYSGTIYPIGTDSAPVNNLTDAKTIADYRGLTTYYLYSDVSIIHNSIDFSNSKFVGESRKITNIYFDPCANINGIRILECSITGTLDSDIFIDNCEVENIDNFSGMIHNSGLSGYIQLSGSVDILISNCETRNSGNDPNIDMGSSGQNLIITNYSGNITLSNMDSSTNVVSIGMDSGSITIDQTVQSGVIIASGIGEIINESSVNIISTSFLSNELISDYVWDENITLRTDPSTAAYILRNIPNVTTNKVVPFIAPLY